MIVIILIKDDNHGIITWLLWIAMVHMQTRLFVHHSQFRSPDLPNHAKRQSTIHGRGPNRWAKISSKHFHTNRTMKQHTIGQTNTCKTCGRPPRSGAAFRAQHDDRKWRSSRSVMTALGFPQQASAHGFRPMFPWQRGRDWCNECAISSAYRPSMPVSTRFVPAPWWS